jgi:hypothetical protein
MIERDQICDDLRSRALVEAVAHYCMWALFSVVVGVGFGAWLEDQMDLPNPVTEIDAGQVDDQN